ncbi:MAG: M6 family metalloprotease domain-containing protein [Bacteroidales bacterium]|nr:M6 family metalloprotease domain-containing protein [Bacteroidales bacterium]
MKKFALLLICLMAMFRASAVPAYPYPVTVTQPDGTTLVIQGHGDEFYHFTTTADGYTIVKNDAGYYVYAQLQNNRLTPTDRIARNQAERTANDVSFLETTGKMLIEKANNDGARKSRRKVATKESDSYYKNFRGLVILINFSDRKFSRSDAHSVYDHMFNDVNYKGYKNENGTSNRYGSMFIGGVRDYFSQNSMGKFAPQFDVVGPVEVDMKSTEVNGNKNAWVVFAQAIANLSSTVDFSKYDADGDGDVDMMYFIVAGYGANYSGNSSAYLWPHKWSLEYVDIPRYNGKRMGKYACSVELYGWESNQQTILDGIGTVCHEFSHVLGLPDEYDTDYEAGGQSHDPGQWSVMAGGSYSQLGRLPVGYSAFQRYASGFLTPKVITSTGKFELNPMQENNEAYMLKTPVDKEFFLLENRQQSGWDAMLPGHGMLVFRVDSTNLEVWETNRVNATPSHNYYELLRAGNSTSGAQTSDPFPGTSNIMTLNNSTTPSLCTWNGTYNTFGLTEITETNGVINFQVNKEGNVEMLVEDFETMGSTSATGSTNVRGRFCSWNFTKCGVVAPGKDACDGTYSVAMKKPSAITTAEPITINPFMISVYFFNPTSTTAKFKVQYSIDKTEWEDLGEVNVQTSTEGKASFKMPTLSEPAYFRVSQVGGSTTAKVYVDNISFSYYKEAGEEGDINGDGTVDVSDVTALINKILGASDYTDEVCDINGDGEINVSDVTQLINQILQ